MGRAKAIDLQQRKITAVNKNNRKNVFTNGADDNYPERIELVINNSVTAKLGLNEMVSFIVGDGFKNKDLNKFIVDKKTGLTAYKLLNICARSYAYHKGCHYHVGYNGLQEISTLSVLPYKNVRIEKQDDLGSKGKLFYSESWGDTGFSFNRKNKKSRWYYPFNKNKKVVEEQFKTDNIKLDLDKGTHNFRGQAYFSNLEPENVYPLAFIDPAYNDADSEYHSSVHRNNLLKNGLTDKTIIVAREGSGDAQGDTQVEVAITEMLGPDGSNVAYIEGEGDDLAKEIHVISLGNDVKADRYEYVDKENQSKILQSQMIHPSLVLNSDSSLFGDGGKKIREIKLNTSQKFEFIRREITEVLTMIFPKHDWTIEPLIKETTNEL